jgi:hypothetical protein
MEFPRASKMNPATAPTGGNPLNRIQVVQQIVDDTASNKRRSLKRLNLKCAQAYCSSGRNVKWSWRQIARKNGGKNAEKPVMRE